MRCRRTSLFFLALIQLSMCAVVPRGLIILCAGDSITAAGYPRFLQRILKQERIRAKVLNYGRSGYTSGEYLLFLEENSAALAGEYPHFVLLQLGTNDVREDGDHTSAEQYEQNLRRIIQIFGHFRTRSGADTRVLLATIPPIPEGSTFPFSQESGIRVVSEINPVIRQLAEEMGMAVVDNYTLLRQEPRLLPDVHPSEEGYRAMALNWYKALEPLIH